MLKARHFPGALDVGCVTLPDDLMQAATIALAGFPQKNLEQDAQKLSSYINSRHPPMEENEYKEKLAEVVETVKQEETIDPMSPGLVEEERKRLLDSRRSKVYEKMKRETYKWKAIDYNEYKSAAYVVARLAPDFASLKRGKRNEDVDQQWPRVIQNPSLKKKHVICHLCTKYGTLQELTVTKRRHGKACYSVSKKASWGDLFPVVLPEPELTQATESTDIITENGDDLGNKENIGKEDM
ncbi:hypothetical protein OTU49_013099 [Cherax quadricarinatus]|uniref:Uncharacterized protein n=1 Tax=Cherax quadricarinatus TaxID=27406 RepID=A0AAW0VUK6_CHEQU